MADDSKKAGAWYYAQGGKSYGPFTTAVLHQLRSAGTLGDETYVWQEGMSEWRPFAEAVPPVVPEPPSTERISSGESSSGHSQEKNREEKELASHVDAERDQQEKDKEFIRQIATKRRKGSDGETFTAWVKRGGIAVLIVLAIGAGNYLTRTFSDYQSRNVSISQLDHAFQNLDSDKYGMFKILKREFREDYDALLVAAKEIALETQDNHTLRSKSADEMRNIRRKYAKYMRSAPDSDLKTVLQQTINLIDEVYANHGPELCGNFAANGPSVLFDKPEYKDALMMQAASVMLALSNGRKSSTKIANATEDDLMAIIVEMKEQGAPAYYFDVLADNNHSHTNYCPSLAAYMQAVISMKGEAGHRVRAEHAETLAKE